MPTGYTYAIEQGCTFEEFVWGCARAFGACVTMRDDPMDNAIPDEFQASDYHSKAVKEAQTELDRLLSLTAAEVEAEIEAERKEIIARNARYAADNDQRKTRYQAVLSKVKAWEPPSPEHEKLKRFMLQQIEVSIPDEPYQQSLPPCDSDAWFTDKKAKAQRDVAYHHQEYAKELERTLGRNEWIRQLRSSVPQPPAKAKSVA